MKDLFYVCLPACVSVHHICAWCPRRSEEALGPLELQLQRVVSHQVDAGN